MNYYRISLATGAFLASTLLHGLTLDVQRFASGQPLPAGYQDVTVGIDAAQVINVSGAPFVDYLIPNNSGTAGITAQKDGGLYITASSVDNMGGNMGGANNGTDPDKWHVVFEWDDGSPLPFGSDYYGVTWSNWGADTMATLTTRIELATTEGITIYHWFNDGWNYANGGHNLLSGHVLTVTQHKADGSVVATQAQTLPSGGAESYFGDHRQFYSSIITATASAAGDYLIIKNEGGNIGYKGTAVALGIEAGGPTITVDGIGTLAFAPADPGNPAPVTGNTRLLNPDGSLSDAAWSGPTDTNPAATDPLWRDRSTWGGLAPEMPHIYTNGNGNLGIMPAINTTVTVPYGSYDVYVVYTADRRPLEPGWTSSVGDAGGSVAAALGGRQRSVYNFSNGVYTGLFGAEINNSLGYDFNLWGVFVGYLGKALNTDTISVDIAPTGTGTRPTYHGIAYIPTNSQPGPGIFDQYEMVDGYINTGTWMGVIYGIHYPWIYSFDLGKYIYVGGANWFNIAQ